MNPARIAKKDGIVVLEIKPNHRNLRLVYNIVLAILLIVGGGLLWMVIARFQNPRFWLDARLMMGILTYLFVFFILVRHWIWYNWGNEVVVIYKDMIHYYRSFIVFAEGKIKKPYKKIEVIYRKNESQKEKSDESLVDDLLTQKKSAIVGFKVDGDDKEIISTFLPISMEDVQKLTDLMR